MNLNLVDCAYFGPREKCSDPGRPKAFSKDLMKKYNIPTAAYGKILMIRKKH